MSNALPNTGTFPPSSSLSLDEFSKDSIKKMAVLFTDIVGSSKFFKDHGDIAGRRMLDLHQTMASPAIAEHGGVLVKLLGDSIMAYFLNPTEALKCGIRIQQEFHNHNQERHGKGQIHIRLCIHFGDGIVEEKDIFGDVVNMAAKFLPMVPSDQIFVSREVKDQISGLSSVRFEPVQITSKEDLLNGVTVYRVQWDKTIDLEPVMKTLLYLKPLWNMGKESFVKAWRRMIQETRKTWEGKVLKESILADKSVVLVLKDPSTSFSYAKNILDSLRTELGRDGTNFLPVQAIIDSGPYLRADKLALEDLKVNWGKIEPGAIYVSATAYESLKTTHAILKESLPAPAQPKPFYKLSLEDRRKDGGNLFLYQDALIQGEGPSCFYCGNKRHPTTRCPSKQLTEFTHTLNKLGYLPLDEINDLFLNYLTETSSGIEADFEVGKASDNKSSRWALYAFHELKAVYQLRFFTRIWNLEEENWNKIKERQASRDQGGLVWIGLDCIRVSNLGQAESILGDSLKKDPKDYKVHCAIGFLNIEKNDFDQAKFYFKKAQDFAKTTPQKILLLFLLSRLYDLEGDSTRAEDRIRKIIRLNPYCAEALYQDILSKFSKDKAGVALQQLKKLIQKYREYFVAALIDPELADYSESIHPFLQNLLQEAREEANKIAPRAQTELAKLKSQFGEDDKVFSDAAAMMSKIGGLLNNDSYFAYIDIIHYGDLIINIGQRSLEIQEKKLLKTIRDLRDRIKVCRDFIQKFPYPFFTESVSQKLRLLQSKVDQNERAVESDQSESFKKVIMRLEGLSPELRQIELKLEHLDHLGQILLFITRFFKKSLVFQSANLLIALILFPITIHYLNFLIPGMKITPENIWSYQKMAMALGGVSGLFLASLTVRKDIP